MVSLSRAWAKALLIAHLLNGSTAAFVILATTVPEPLKHHILLANTMIGGVLAAFQAFSKSLGDRDGDGTPDPFDETPDGDPPKPSGGG